jgi:hypothetical protein
MRRLLNWYSTARIGCFRLADDGGWVQAALMGAGMLGKLFGGGAKASADARAKEAQLNEQRDQTAISRYQAEQNANTQNARTDLDQRGFALSAPGQRAGNSIRGDILATLQKPTGQHGKFNFTGSAPTLSADTRQTGQLMARDALLQQLKGDVFDPIPKIAVPQASAIPKAGFMEKLGGILGTIGGVAGGIGDMREQGLFGGGGASSVLSGASMAPTDVMGALPGGAVRPRATPLRLPSRPISLG